MHYLSMSWHIISLKSFSWNITLWRKRAHQSTNFHIFQCFIESSLNSSYQFWNHKVNVHSIFASLFSVMIDNSSIFFYLKPLYLEQKDPTKVKFSNFWVVAWKLTKFLKPCLKLQVSFSLNFASIFSIMIDNSFVIF